MPFGSIRRMVHIARALLLILFLPLLLPAQASSPKTVTAAEADSHLVMRIEPAIPPLAKTAKVGGKLRLPGAHWEHVFSRLRVIFFVSVRSWPC